MHISLHKQNFKRLNESQMLEQVDGMKWAAAAG